MIVDYDGRLLAQADSGPGEKIVVAPIDVGSLRHERERRLGHDMRAHLRTEAYPMYQRPIFPANTGDNQPHTAAANETAIAQGRRNWQTLQPPAGNG